MLAIGKRLLAISWMMPPLVYPRSIQVSRTLKGLRARGWTTDVVSIKPVNSSKHALDARLAEIYNGEYSLHTLDLHAWRRIRSLLSRYMTWANPLNSADESIWLRQATIEANRCIRRGVDALVTFGQPWIDHVVGLECTRRHPRLPWIAHFSDPWVDNPYVANYAPARLEQWQTEERSVIERANAVVFVNARTAELVMSKYADVPRSKIFVVPHTYDHEILSRIKGSPRTPGKLHIVHTGNLYALRRPHAVLRALRRLINEHSGEIAVTATFIGAYAQEDEALARELGIDPYVKFLPAKPFIESLQLAAAADFLLLIDTPTEEGIFLPSKVVDYFLLEKPILGITPTQGATADALRRTGHYVAPPDDAEAIYHVLTTMTDRWKSDQLASQINHHEVERYEVRSTSIEFERAVLAAIHSRDEQ
jgi:hypothetical protein